MTSLLRLLLVPALLVLGSSAALAHATLLRSDPAVGETVPAHGFPVELQFNSRADATRSRLVLTMADGSARKLEAHSGNNPSIIAVQVDEVPPGPCTLRYDVLSNDGHVASGSITFTATKP